MANRTVTIQDVAALAGTSISTVSNLLNGRVGKMRPETRARVEEAMDQLGYRASEVARHLKTGQAPIIGLVIPSVANPFWGNFVQCVEETANQRGYQVLLGNGGRDPVREQRYAESLWAHGVRGVIFGSSPLSLDYIMRLVERGLKAVVFDRRLRETDHLAQAGVDSVSIDNVAVGYQQTRHLLDLGHRRIGFLSGPLRTASRLDRLEGYRNALIEAGIRHDPALVWEGIGYTGSGDVEGAEIGRDGAKHLLSLDNQPTALVTINDMYALGAYAGVRDAGLRIPDDVSVIGVDDIVLAGIVTPGLTTIKQPVAEMMTIAVETLIGRLDGSRTGKSHHVTVDIALVDRGSTGPALESDAALPLSTGSGF